MAITPVLTQAPYVGPPMAGTMNFATGSGSDPFVRDAAVLAMSVNWEVMDSVTNGSAWLRSRAGHYLKQEPREDETAWRSRVERSVLSPFTVRLIENAAGLVLRKPIEIVGDDFWKEQFAYNVDGLGSNINEFARRRLVVALAYGHSAIMVDYPQVNARTLREERDAAPQPYWTGVDPQQILGWRQASRVPSSPLTQVRIMEMQTFPEGEYGETVEEVVRVLRPGGYQVIKTGGEVIERGTFSLGQIPIVPIYTQRIGMLSSSPPLLDVASLNIAHYQRQADLLHALHVAAMPILVLEGWDEERTTAGVNYALGMEPGSKAYYVQSDASSFESQTNMLTQLEQQMSHLGITKLLGQKMVAEAADAKRIDQQQANSVLAIISMELESSINDALKMSAEYMGVEPPTAVLSRDFDLYRLLGQDASVLAQMEAAGQITPETFLRIMRHGEWLPDEVDLAKEVEETKKLKEEAEAKAMEQMQMQTEQQIAVNAAKPAAGGGGGGKVGGKPPAK